MKPGLDKIKSVSTPSSYERAVRYFREGRVESVERFGDRITATVRGTESYKVTVRLYGDDFTASCTCPYSLGGYCKHVVAVLLHLFYKGEGEKSTDKETFAPEPQDAALTPDSSDRMFASRVFEKVRYVSGLLDIYIQFPESARKRLQKYKSELRLLYRKALKGSGYHRYGIEVNFQDFHDLTNFYIRRGDYDEALLINQAVSEVIAEKMDWVDDSDGYYGGEFADTIHDLANVLKESGSDHRQRRPWIRYLFKKFIENDPDFFEEYYYIALQMVCTDTDDLKYWRGLLEPHMPPNLPSTDDFIVHFRAWRLCSMMLHILEGLGAWDEFYSLMERDFRNDYKLCLWYARRLAENGRPDQATEVAEEGLTLFPEHLREDLRRFLGEFYKSSDPQKYKCNLTDLFLEKRNWGDYEELKALCTPEEWNNTLKDITAELKRNHIDRDDVLLETYLREDMHDKALDMVLAKKSLHYLEKYHERLAPRYPAEYFRAYMELIVPFVKHNMGHAHYREVAGYLQLMKGIKGFEKETLKLIETFETDYARRPAFVEELGKIR
ncbi:SWIM zinc finger family protein [candidate division WOR-3 bacterium]|nr:SWIM zinc finger family protein [candidate division WOR-3 bacterium]